MKGISLEYGFLVFQFFVFVVPAVVFSLQSFRNATPFSSGLMVSDSKLAVLFICVCFSMCNVFAPLAPFSIFPLSLVFSHFTMIYLGIRAWFIFVLLVFGSFGEVSILIGIL